MTNSIIKSAPASGKHNSPRKAFIIFSIVTGMMLTVLSSCKKYPDGPALSLRSKAERVANNWKVGQAFENGKDVTADYNKYELILGKAGSANLTATYKFLGTDYNFVTSGTWAFVSNKEKISANFDNDDADAVYVILELKENEMWLRKDGETLELHFVPM